MRIKRLLKILAFAGIFLVLFSIVSKILVAPNDYRNYQRVGGFYEEPENSLDAVYIGSSTCYAFWNPMVAWDKYGLAIYPYSANSQHFIAAEHLIREVRKTQPDALFIVTINTIDDEKMNVFEFHYQIDYMPFSLNKLSLIRHLSKNANLPFREEMELYLPFYRYHERWSQLDPQDFKYQVDGLKGVSTYSTYNYGIFDISSMYASTDEIIPPADYVNDSLMSLMDFCEEENVNVLFVTVPRAESVTRVAELNYINSMLESRGFATLNLLKHPEAMKFDYTQDFYNEGHTNLHGSIKYTSFLSEYLIEHYGFKSHHGDALYNGWGAGYEKYSPTMFIYALDIEMDVDHRTTDLLKPGNLTAVADGQNISVTWEASEGAEGYAVYRKAYKGCWERLSTTEELCFTDSGAQTGIQYQYTVVPFCTSDGETFYGCFDYLGAFIELQ
ncbi:MAG: hypothetical protein E7331_01590 [Clostridiales bacterium]|nr:hypothetical protein [Clostridiales bacterium]